MRRVDLVIELGDDVSYSHHHLTDRHYRLINCRMTQDSLYVFICSLLLSFVVISITSHHMTSLDFICLLRAFFSVQEKQQNILELITGFEKKHNGFFQRTFLPINRIVCEISSE